MFYHSYSNILVKFRQPTIFEPDHIGKSYYLPQKKALNFNFKSSISIQGFLLRYITLSYVIWLKYDMLSKFGKNA